MNRKSIIYPLALIILLVSMHSFSQSVLKAVKVESSTLLKKRLSEKLKTYQLFTLPMELVKSKGEQNVSFQIETLTEKWDIELRPHEIRTDECKILEFTKKGAKEISIQDCPTFAGSVNGNDTRFFINDDVMAGTIYESDDIVMLEPLSWFLGTSEFGDAMILYKESDILDTGGYCGVKPSINKIKTNQNIRSAISAKSASCQVLNVALEYDYEFHQLFANNGGAISKALNIMQNVDYIYFRDIGLRVCVSWLGGWSDVNDPFSNSTLYYDVSADFWSFWNANRNDVSRDIAHMLTGKELTTPTNGNSNGEANLTNICSSNRSYSMSDRGSGSDSDWASCVSHEMGHNLGHPGHDGDDGSGICNTQRYIMCEGMNKSGVFSSNSIGIISNFLTTVSCLGTRTTSISSKIDGNTINSTPTYISSGNHTLNIINNDAYINNNTFTYAPNNGQVSYNPSGSYCYFSTNGVSSFTMQITYTNECGTFYRGIPFVIYSPYRVFPNPSKDVVTVAFEMDEKSNNRLSLPTDISLYNERQEIIKTSKPQDLYEAKNLSVSDNKIIFDMKGYARGLYVLSIVYGNGKTDKIKVILE